MNKKKELVILGNNLRAERNRQKLSQEALAEIANLQMHHISRIESGMSDIRFSTLLALMKALNLDFHQLYNFDEKTK